MWLELSDLFTDRSNVENEIWKSKLSVCEILLPHLQSITCIPDIVRTLKGLNRWKRIVGPIRWRKEEGTEKMWGLIWSCGLNPSPSHQNKGTLPKCQISSFDFASSCMHVYLYMYIYMYIKPNCLSLGDSAVPAESTVYLSDKYKSCHLKCCWNMLIFLQQGARYKRC